MSNTPWFHSADTSPAAADRILLMVSIDEARASMACGASLGRAIDEARLRVLNHAGYPASYAAIRGGLVSDAPDDIDELSAAADILGGAR